MKFCKILDLNVKVKNEESKFWPIVTVYCDDEVLECDNCAVRLSPKDSLISPMPSVYRLVS